MRYHLLLPLSAAITVALPVYSAPPENRIIEERRNYFDELYKQIRLAQDEAIDKLDALDENSKAPERLGVRTALLRQRDLVLAMTQWVRSLPKPGPADPQSDEFKSLIAEEMREARRLLPFAQREIVIANKVLGKYPHNADALFLAPPNGYVQITSGDYPALALRMNHEGRVRYRLEYGPDGRTTNCTVTASSGYAELDDQTCLILTHRAQFASGAPGKRDGSILWKIPVAPSPTPVYPTYSGQARSAYERGYALGKAQAAAAIAGNHP